MKKIRIKLCFAFILLLVGIINTHAVEVDIDVPFVSQSMTGCGFDNMFCGHTSCLMVFSYYNGITDILGQDPTKQGIKNINNWLSYHYADHTNSDCGQGTPDPSYLVKVAKEYGRFSDSRWYGDYNGNTDIWDINDLKDEIDRGYPVIVQVHIRMNTDNATHWMVLRGYVDSDDDGDIDEVIVNDPGLTAGEYDKYPVQTFLDSWDATNNRCVAIHDGVINDGLPIYLGKVESTTTLNLRFKLKSNIAESNLTVTSLTINSTAINAGSVSYIGTNDAGMHEYYFTVEVNTNDFPAGGKYNIEFDLNNGGVLEKSFKGLNQVYAIGHYSDLDPSKNEDVRDEWYYKYVNKCLDLGLVVDANNVIPTTYHSGEDVKRSEMAKIVFHAAYDLNLISVSTAGIPFPDALAGPDYFVYVQSLKNAGVVNGYASGAQAGNYGPDNKLNRAELCVFLDSGFDLPDVDPTFLTDLTNTNYPFGSFADVNDNDISPWYYAPIKKVVNTWVSYSFSDIWDGFPIRDRIASGTKRDGIKYFDPAKNLNRAEIAKFVTNAFLFKKDQDTDNNPAPPLAQLKSSEYNTVQHLKSGTINSNSTVGANYEQTASVNGTPPSKLTFSGGATTTSINEGQTLNLSYPGSTDSDGDPLFFYWAVSDGTLTSTSSNHRTVTFTPPAISKTTDIKLFTLCGDGNGYIAEGNLTITVNSSSGSATDDSPVVSNITVSPTTPTKGTPATISWNVTDDNTSSNQLKIWVQYKKSASTWDVVAYDVSNTGSVSWTPSESGTSRQVRIKAKDATHEWSEIGWVYSSAFNVSQQALQAPENLRVDEEKTYYYKMAWDKPERANRYILQEATDASFTENVKEHEITTILENPYRAIYNTASTRYYHRVKAFNDTEESGWSNTVSHYWDNDLLPTVNTISPANESQLNNNSVELNWEGLQGNAALQYTVYLADWNPAGQPPILENTTQTSYTATNLEYNKKYYWQVKITDSDGDEDWSQRWDFTILPEANPPTGSITIAGGAATTNAVSVLLNLSATDSQGEVEYMRFSNDNQTWSNWYWYAPTSGAWNLGEFGGNTQTGTKTVYAQFKDNSDNISTTYSDNITLEAGVPGNIILRDKHYASLRRAIDDAQPSDNIYITAGFYDLTGEVDNSPYFDQSPSLNVGTSLKEGVNIIGEGAEKTTLYWNEGGSGLIINGNNIVEGLTIVRPTFEGNTREAVVIAGSNSTLRNCIIKDSDFAIYTWSGGPFENVTITNCIITNNDERVRLGNINNLNFTNNVISSSIWLNLEVYDCTGNIKNNIVTGATQDGIQVFNYGGISFHNNNIWGNQTNYTDGTSIPDQTGINGNISQDPQFVNAAVGNFRLASNSPCISAGTDVGIPYLGTPDIGYYEYTATGSLVVSTNVNANFVITFPDGSSQNVSSPWNQSNLPIGIYGIYPQDYPGYYKPYVRFINVQANQTETFNDPYVVDNDGPVGAIQANGFDYFTQSRYVTIFNDVTDPVNRIGTNSQMQFSNDGVSWSDAEPVSNKKRYWDLNAYGGDLSEGDKKVYARFSDNNGHWGEAIIDSIQYQPNGKIIRVPDDYANINDAVDSAQIGDIVYVLPGEYETKREDSWADFIIREGIKLQGCNKDSVIITTSETNLHAESVIDNITWKGYSMYTYGDKPQLISNCIFDDFDRLFAQSTNNAMIVSNSIFKNLSNDFGFIYNPNQHGFKGKITNNVFDAGTTAVTGKIGIRIRLEDYPTNEFLEIKNNIFTGFDNGNDNYGAIVIDHDDDDPGDIVVGHNNYFNTINDIHLSFGPNISAQKFPFYLDPQFDTDTTYILSPSSPLKYVGNTSLFARNHDGTNNTLGIEGGPLYNTPPQAKAAVNPKTGSSKTLFTFDASGSVDEQTPVEYLQVRWDFDNDGTLDTDFLTELTIEHQFNTISTDSITCWVFDEHFAIDYMKIANPVVNTSPKTPENPTPEDNQTDIPVDNLQLTWSGDDIDGDTVEYYIYFGNPNDGLTLLDSTLVDTSYVLTTTLENNKIYSWQILAKDEYDASSIGAVWSFTTINNPPEFNSSPFTETVEDNVYTYNITATDNDVGANLTIICAVKPSWLTFTDNGDGTAILTGTPGEINVGPNVVRLTLTDGFISSPIEQEFTITVTRVNKTISLNIPANTIKMVALPIEPENDRVPQAIGNVLPLYMEGNSQLYVPDWGLNTLSMDEINGYKIFFNEAQTIVFDGTMLKGGQQLFLLANTVKIIGYPYSSVHTALEVFGAYPSIIYVADDEGNLYVPGWGLTNMDLQPGKALKVFSTEDLNFTYPVLEND